LNNGALDLNGLESRYDNFFAPCFSIVIDGVDIQNAGAQIVSLSVDNDLAGADQFSFTINNPYNPDNGVFEWLDNSVIENEKEVIIEMGYSGDKEVMIIGVISSIKASFGTGGGSQLSITGYDLSYRMMKGKKTNTWSGKKDSDVVNEIANAYKFTAIKTDDTQVEFPVIKQDKESDFDFVKKLAERNGYEFSVYGRTLSFISPPADPATAAVLQWGKTLNSFSPEITTTEQVTEVKVIGWSKSTKSEISGSARAQDSLNGNPSVEEIRRPVYDVAHANKLAQSILATILRGRVKGSGECLGIPLLKPGLGIELQGLGSLFSKKYYIEKTTHSIGTSGYKTTFTVREAGL
jgi:phage protein D